VLGDQASVVVDSLGGAADLASAFVGVLGHVRYLRSGAIRYRSPWRKYVLKQALAQQL
jgi:hypothetical protein